MLPKKSIIRNKWKDIINDINKKNNRWIYRGMLDGWHLKTTLERYCEVSKVKDVNRFKVENNLIREFKRKYNHIASDVLPPPKADTLWWLSVMQHHGAPTRLLDWTYSPYIAAYFSFESQFNPDNIDKAAIWAIRIGWLLDEGKSFFKSEKGKFKDIRDNKEGSLDYLFEGSGQQTPFVLQANTYHLHKRLSIQQGVFLCAADISISFEDNLKSMKDWDNPMNIRKYVITNNCLPNVFQELYKMNINRASLFPGLDGFAKSLQTRLKFIPSSGSYPRR